MTLCSRQGKRAFKSHQIDHQRTAILLSAVRRTKSILLNTSVDTIKQNNKLNGFSKNVVFVIII